MASDIWFVRPLGFSREQERRARLQWFTAGGAPCFWSDGSSSSSLSTMDLQQYLPVILFIVVGAGVGIAPQVLGFLLGPQRPDAAKNSPYECGFEAFEDARMKFDVRYYLVAILFILFDLEIAFLFPWAVSLRDIGASGFWAMMLFLTILVVGFIYEWKKGALDWE
jgi:NADH-quinone oxidoreductase subunit A